MSGRWAEMAQPISRYDHFRVESQMILLGHITLPLKTANRTFENDVERADFFSGRLHCVGSLKWLLNLIRVWFSASEYLCFRLLGDRFCNTQRVKMGSIYSLFDISDPFHRQLWGHQMHRDIEKPGYIPQNTCEYVRNQSVKHTRAGPCFHTIDSKSRKKNSGRFGAILHRGVKSMKFDILDASKSQLRLMWLKIPSIHL